MANRYFWEEMENIVCDFISGLSRIQEMCAEEKNQAEENEEEMEILLYNEKEYLYFFELRKAGNMTEAKWNQYCTAYLTKIMQENADVFKRLKDR